MFNVVKTVCMSPLYNDLSSKISLSESFLVWCPDHFPLTQPLNSHEWPRQNFSLKYPYDINQISDESE